MQQQPESPLSSQRTRPALSRMRPPAAVVAGSLRSSHALASASRQRGLWGKIALLLLLLLLIEVGLLALYPLFITTNSTGDALQKAWSTLFLWLPRLYWTNTPVAQGELSLLPWLSPLTAVGKRHLIICATALALVGSLLAALVGRWIERRSVPRFTLSILFCLVLFGTLLSGLTLLFVPVSSNLLMQPTLLNGFYGRMLAFYHLSPYGAIPASLHHDPLWSLLQNGGATLPDSTGIGPVWLDICLLIALLSGNSIGFLMFGFRLLGLLAHVGNVILLWHGLSRFKPATRVTGTLLYAWNPLVLLFSVVFMRQEVVLLLFLLLATLFLQRASPTLAWILVVLSALMNSFYLLLLPVAFSFLLRQSRLLTFKRCLLWWIGMLCITVLVSALAYAPYWHGWGLSGIGASLRQSFFPPTAINSLDAALQHLPITLPTSLSWLLKPQSWATLVLALEALLLLIGIWLIDTVPMALLFSCWVLLLGIMLEPIYWPWYMLPPLGLAIYSTNRRTLELTILLMAGAFACMWFWLSSAPDAGLALAFLAVPILLWGWLLFFVATWHMAHKEETIPETTPDDRQRYLRLSSFSWPRNEENDREGTSLQ